MKTKARYLENLLWDAQGRAHDAVTARAEAATEKATSTPRIRRLKAKRDELDAAYKKAYTKYREAYETAGAAYRQRGGEKTFTREYDEIKRKVREVEGRILFAKDYDSIILLIATIK